MTPTKPKMMKREMEDLCNKTPPLNSFKCSLCDYVSDKSANLSRHVRSMHEIVKVELVCCGFRFTSKADYRVHNQRSHKEGHVCSQCGKSFSRRALLKRHQSVHTGIKDFKCHLCPYSSSHKSNVVRHTKIHQALPGVPPKPIRHPEPDSTTTTATSTTGYSSASSTINITKSDTGNDIPSKFSGFGSITPITKKDSSLPVATSKKSRILRAMLNSPKISEQPEEGQGCRKIKHSIDSILDKREDDGKVQGESGGQEEEEEGERSIPVTSPEGHLEEEDPIYPRSFVPVTRPPSIPNSHMNTFPLYSPYLPVEFTSSIAYPSTNWSYHRGLPFTYHPRSTGFGSMMGHEDSRYLSSPHSQGSYGPGLTSAFYGPCFLPSQSQMPPSAHMSSSLSPGVSYHRSIGELGSSVSSGSPLTFLSHVRNQEVTHFVTY